MFHYLSFITLLVGFLMISSIKTDSIELYRANSNSMGHYGITQINRIFYILVSSANQQKNILVHHQKQDNSWEDVKAKFAESINNELELWIAEINWISQGANGPSEPFNWGNEFVLKLEQSGQIIWDNNNGLNYLLERHGGALLGRNFPVSLAFSVLNFFSWNNRNSFSGSVYVQNLAPQKDLKIIYSCDGWKNSKIANGSYNYEFRPSYASTIKSPNSNGVENWSFDESVADLNCKYVEFYLSLDINGRSYVNNNFGRNFNAKINNN